MEDEVEEAETLRSYFARYTQEYGTTFTVTHFLSAEAFLNRYRPVYDLVLMDICLPKTSGMDAAALLRRVDQSVSLIFVTNMAQFAVKGYEVDAFDFVVKPVSYADLSQTLGRLLKDSLEGGFISVNCSNQIVKVFLSELVYTETQRHYQALFLADGTTARTRMTRAELCELLGPRKRFARVGASFLVNLDYVVRVAPDGIELLGDRVVHIPRRALAELKRQYFDYYCGGEAAEI